MNVVLFGIGKWGRILQKNLNEKYHLIKIFNSKSMIKKFDFSNIKWAIVATNNVNHYKIIKYLLNKNINIFCEKPLTLSYKESKEIISKANSKNIKIFINHIYEYKKVKIKFKSINYILRSKISVKTFEDILFDLFYHDLYLVLKFIKTNKVDITKLKYNNKNLEIQISSNNKIFNFNYNTDRHTEHKINGVNLIDNINYIPSVFENVFNSNVDFKRNNSIALICNKVIDELIRLNKSINV